MTEIKQTRIDIRSIDDLDRLQFGKPRPETLGRNLAAGGKPQQNAGQWDADKPRFRCDGHVAVP